MSTASDLTNRLETFPVVSFNVFDTLITRVLWRPEDVFYVIAEKIDDASFVKKRIRAERNARVQAKREHGHDDITFDEIYATPDLPDVRELELEIEKSICVGNPRLAAIVAQAQKLGKKVVAISDMYLPAAFIRELLDSAGFADVEKIYVSSQTRKTKATGQLFTHVLSDLDISKDDILHIGDNEYSDVAVPNKLGIASFHYPAPREQSLQSNRINPAIVEALVNEGGLETSLIAGLFAVKNLLPSPEQTDYWLDTGYHAAGPLAFAFTSWIAKRATALNLDAIYFLSRDGALPAKIYEAHFSDIESHYVYASRRMFLVPSIRDMDDRTVQALTNGEINTPAREYVERLDIGAPDGLDEDLTKLFGDPLTPICSKDQLEELGRLFKKYEDWFKSAAATELEPLLAYLKSVGFVDAERKAIVDLGWMGSTQRSMETLPVETDNLFGFYLGLGKRGYDNGRNEGFAFTQGIPSQEHTKIFKCVEYYELLFSADHYSVMRMHAESDGLKPRFEMPNPHEDKRMSIAERIHRGALEFCDDYVQYARKLALGNLTPELAMMATDAVLSHPTDLDVRMIGDTYHSKGMGDAPYRPIIPQEPLSLTGWLSFIFGGKDLNRFMSYWTIGYRYRHKIFKKLNFLGFVFEKAMWLPPKIKKARMLGARAAISAFTDILKRRLLRL